MMINFLTGNMMILNLLNLMSAGRCGKIVNTISGYDEDIRG